MNPILLGSNQPPERFYLGGPQISKFRGESSQGPHTPEDWVASTTCCRGHATLGQTTLPDGTSLVQEITKDPELWLGAEHVRAYGADSKILVKLLDAGQRLPIHAHPSGTWAKANIGALHGKAEAWYILTPGEVYLGLKEDVSREQLQEYVDAQEIETMLALMHRVPVKPHQTVYVPPGVLHAIGEGILLAEVQEPEDLSILLEWRDFKIDGAVEGHLGLGFDRALQAVEVKGRARNEIDSLVTTENAVGSVLADAANEYFLIERVQVNKESGSAVQRAGFAVAIVVDGNIEMASERGKKLHIQRGNTVVVPYGAGSLELKGQGEILFARPPAPVNPDHVK